MPEFSLFQKNYIVEVSCLNFHRSIINEYIIFVFLHLKKLTGIPMKKITLLMAILITALISISSEAQNPLVFKCPFKINGIQHADSVLCFNENGYYSAEVKHLMEATGGKFFPFADLFEIHGFATQYGKIIAFARNGYDTGFYKSIVVKMFPPAQKIAYAGSLLQFAPLNFLSKALGDTVYFDNGSGSLQIQIHPPDTIGCLYPPAAAVAKSLEHNGYLVNQGSINLTSAINICNAGYSINCQGNNAGFPYLVMNTPPSPAFDTLNNMTIVFNLQSDEAILLIGKTPPKCKYFSYRSYLAGRVYTMPDVTLKKIYASLGDTKNLYSMNKSVPASAMFERNFALICAADSNIAAKTKQLILQNTSIPESDIYFDIIPGDIFKFGNAPKDDWGSFLHRASVFENESAGQAYINNPTLEVLRITPSSPVTPSFFHTPKLTSRNSGIDEYFLNEDFEYLEKTLFNEYDSSYSVSLLHPSVWLVEGYEAIQEEKDVLGEVRDALYMRTEAFNFNKDDIVVAYGVNHTKTGKAVYTDVSCYRDSLFAGFGGIEDSRYAKTARKYFSDTTTADYFFTYKFARSPLPGDTNVFVVPQDTAHNMMGINYGDKSFLGFRAYIDTLTHVGPSPEELIYDRGLLLRPKGSGFADLGTSADIDWSVNPNPAHDVAVFEINVKNPTNVTIIVSNLSGQLIGRPANNRLVNGSENITWNIPEGLPKGVYTVRLYALEQGRQQLFCTTKKIIVG